MTNNPTDLDLLRFLHKKRMGMNEFARAMVHRLESGRDWTPNMRAAILRMYESENSQSPIVGEKVDLTAIKTMFDNAVSNGHKRPAYRADGVIITRAPDTGRNAGALYVKTEGGEYRGKLVGGTEWMPVLRDNDTINILKAIAKDPLESAVRYGRKTGRCSCCGRELTNKLSIELGIGPICREKWGL